MSSWLNWIELHPLATAIVAGLVVFCVSLPFLKSSRILKKAAEARDISLAHSPRAQLVVGNDNTLTQHFHEKTTVLINEQPAAKPDYRSTPTPTEIMQAFKGRPSYEHDGITQAFVNLPVDWDVLLSGVRKHGIAAKPHYQILVICDSTKLSNPIISCTNVDIEQYPRLKRAIEGDRLRVRGLIANISPTIITLKDAEFIFPEIF